MSGNYKEPEDRGIAGLGLTDNERSFIEHIRGTTLPPDAFKDPKKHPDYKPGTRIETEGNRTMPMVPQAMSVHLLDEEYKDVFEQYPKLRDAIENAISLRTQIEPEEKGIKPPPDGWGLHTGE